MTPRHYHTKHIQLLQFAQLVCNFLGRNVITFFHLKFIGETKERDNQGSSPIGSSYTSTNTEQSSVYTFT